MANSYNGWPASPDPRAIGLVPLSVAGTRPFSEGGFPGGVVGGPVHTVFSYLVSRLHTEVEPMLTKDGQLGYGCWAYQYRANVNNPSQLSCHASGTGIDYNATRHPNGTSTGPSGGGGWSSTQYRKIQEILTACSGSVRWLTGNDPMHFEIYGSGSAVAAAAARIQAGGGGVVGTGPDKPEPPTGGATDWWDTVDEATVRRIVSEEVSNVLGRGGRVNGLFVTDVLSDMWKRGQDTKALIDKLSAEAANEYDAIIYEDKGGLWLSEGGDSAPIPDPATLAGIQYRLSQQGKRLMYWPGGDVTLPGAFGRQGGGIPGPDPVAPPTTYTVAKGDTFNGIAGRFGVTPDQLAALNPQVKDRNNLDIGTVLNVPKA